MYIAHIMAVYMEYSTCVMTVYIAHVGLMVLYITHVMAAYCVHDLTDCVVFLCYSSTRISGSDGMRPWRMEFLDTISVNYKLKSLMDHTATSAQ